MQEISLAGRRRREKLRSAFLPSRLRLLFIGESPPASGRFVYQRDSGLYRAMRDAFAAVDPLIDDENFLNMFQSSGCYLVDLCADPVDRLDAALRRSKCRGGELRLAKTIARLQPFMIATLVRSIENNVANAIMRADWRGPLIHLPYPGRWIQHRAVFTAALIPAIRPLLHTG